MSLDRMRLAISLNILRRNDNEDNEDDEDDEWCVRDVTIGLPVVNDDGDDVDVDDNSVVLSASVKKCYMYLFSAFSNCLILRLERSQSQ